MFVQCRMYNTLCAMYIAAQNTMHPVPDISVSFVLSLFHVFNSMNTVDKSYLDRTPHRESNAVCAMRETHGSLLSILFSHIEHC